MSGALETLLTLPARTENPYVKKAKDKGDLVIGYMCGYVPDEIIYAAGALPYRLEATGATSTELGEAYFYKFFCTFTTSLLNLGLQGQYQFLDGICFLNGCDQLRRLIGIWQEKVKSPGKCYLEMITVPHKFSEEGYKWYLEELQHFKESFKGYFGLRLTNDDLRNAIKVYNESRRLIARLYDLRRSDHPPITGADAFQLVTAAFSMPRDEYNVLLKEALDELEGREGISGYRARIMVGGSVCDDSSFIRLIESRGCLVVTDSLCFGGRHFTTLIDEEGDPLEAIAKRYFYHNPCPRMAGEFELRTNYIKELYTEAKADGLILQKLGFCDNHGVENSVLSKDLEADGIPVLKVDRQHILSDVGRYSTRFDAFLERLEGRAGK